MSEKSYLYNMCRVVKIVTRRCINYEKCGNVTIIKYFDCGTVEIENNSKIPFLEGCKRYNYLIRNTHGLTSSTYFKVREAKLVAAAIKKLLQRKTRIKLLILERRVLYLTAGKKVKFEHIPKAAIVFFASSWVFLYGRFILPYLWREYTVLKENGLPVWYAFAALYSVSSGCFAWFRTLDTDDSAFKYYLRDAGGNAFASSIFFLIGILLKNDLLRYPVENLSKYRFHVSWLSRPPRPHSHHLIDFLFFWKYDRNTLLVFEYLTCQLLIASACIFSFLLVISLIMSFLVRFFEKSR